MAKKKTEKDSRTASEQKEYDKKVGFVLVSAAGGSANALGRIYEQADFLTTLNYLHDVDKKVQKGNFYLIEDMLISQAHVLHALFNTQSSAAVRAEYVPEAEMHATMAFRAQNQCLRTLRTLLEYKNPKRATFIKQQNNAINQQINQGEEKKENEINPANELLEVNHDARLDPGTAQEASEGHQEVEAVGEIDRPEE